MTYVAEPEQFPQLRPRWLRPVAGAAPLLATLLERRLAFFVARLVLGQLQRVGRANLRSGHGERGRRVGSRSLRRFRHLRLGRLLSDRAVHVARQLVGRSVGAGLLRGVAILHIGEIETIRRRVRRLHCRHGEKAERSLNTPVKTMHQSRIGRVASGATTTNTALRARWRSALFIGVNCIEGRKAVSQLASASVASVFCSMSGLT
ncbi:hypothetical protein C5688_20590 [Methylocystis sp. MitZ-2018]|uniref:hypothetical protein n=1 Tax=Methylosinus sporium TaxID=428 RepID=UPI000D59FE22|nr:hypothetical protein C5688_20590 [Methylocystis sp. MitZ-2018]